MYRYTINDKSLNNQPKYIMTDIITDTEYKEWISSLSGRYRTAQIRASVETNKELLKFYWQLGKIYRNDKMKTDTVQDL